MADQKITALTADATPTSDDLIVTVTDPAGTPANRKVTLANLGLGIAPAWADWSPTLTNLSGGTLTYSKYVQVGKLVFFRFKYTLAGAGVAGAVDITVPVTAAHAATTETILGNCTLIDTGTADTVARMLWIDTSKFRVQAQTASGTYVAITNISSTIPHTWANTDVIFCVGCYEAA